MSHFVLLVFGDPSTVEKQLAPYHEFECTGVDDEYVVEIDRLDELRAEYAVETGVCMVAPDGTLHSVYDEDGNFAPQFSRFDEDGKRVQHTPDGYVAEMRPVKEFMTEAFYAAYWYGVRLIYSEADVDRRKDHKYGYAISDANGNVVKCVRRTNPNKKWDWWVIGGRWANFFGPDRRTTVTVDEWRVARERNLAAHRATAEKLYDDVMEILDQYDAPRTWLTWAEIRDTPGTSIDEARTKYNDQIQIQVLKMYQVQGRSLYGRIGWSESLDGFLLPKEEFANQRAITWERYHAVLRDGQWVERGNMGWWAIVTDEKNDWDQQCEQFMASLPGDEKVTVVDCHI